MFEATRKQLRDWAIEHGSDTTRYALKNGYDSAKQIEIDYALSLCPEIHGTHRETRDIRVIGERPLPNKQAIAAVEEIHRSVKLSGLLDGMTIKISRILRVSNGGPRTAIQVTIGYQWLNRPVVVTYIVEENHV